MPGVSGQQPLAILTEEESQVLLTEPSAPRAAVHTCAMTHALVTAENSRKSALHRPISQAIGQVLSLPQSASESHSWQSKILSQWMLQRAMHAAAHTGNVRGGAIWHCGNQIQGACRKWLKDIHQVTTWSQHKRWLCSGSCGHRCSIVAGGSVMFTSSQTSSPSVALQTC